MSIVPVSRDMSQSLPPQETTSTIDNHNPPILAPASNLLTLPAEIRYEIWLLCLTNLHIHIEDRDDEQELRAREESSSFSSRFKPDVVIDLRRYGGEGGSESRGFTHSLLPKSTCPPYNNGIFEFLSIPGHTSRPRQHLPSIWRVCRQLYNETALLPYHDTNIFSFAKAGTLRSFWSRRAGDLAHIPRLWFPDQDGARVMMDLFKNDASAAIHDNETYDIQSAKPMDNLKEVWIMNSVAYYDRLARNEHTMFRALAREQLIKVKECVKCLVLFWEARGVTVVLKDSSIQHRPRLLRYGESAGRAD